MGLLKDIRDTSYCKKKEIEVFAASKFYFLRKNTHKTLMYESLTMASKKLHASFTAKEKKGEMMDLLKSLFFESNYYFMY